MLTQIVVLRFTLAFIASFAFGWMRQMRGKPIGFGTFIFLAQGSCALSLTAQHLAADNPLPLMSATVTGIGFLGAGALMRTGERVVGFTSAATIWAFAILGLCLGVGEYLIAALLYLSIWTVALFDLYMERRWIGSHQRKLELVVELGITDADLDDLGVRPLGSAQTIQVDRTEATLTLTYLIHKEKGETDDLMRRLHASQKVKKMTLES